MCESKGARPCSTLGVNWVRKMAQEYGKLFRGGWRPRPCSTGCRIRGDFSEGSQAVPEDGVQTGCAGWSWKVLQFHVIEQAFAKHPVLRAGCPAAAHGELTGLWSMSAFFFIEFKNTWDFPGGPVVKTPSSQCRGPRVAFWFREPDPVRHN